MAWNYYQTTNEPMNAKFVAAFKAEYGADKNTADPIEAGSPVVQPIVQSVKWLTVFTLRIAIIGPSKVASP